MQTKVRIEIQDRCVSNQKKEKEKQPVLTIGQKDDRGMIGE